MRPVCVYFICRMLECKSAAPNQSLLHSYKMNGWMVNRQSQATPFSSPWYIFIYESSAKPATASYRLIERLKLCTSVRIWKKDVKISLVAAFCYGIAAGFNNKKCCAQQTNVEKPSLAGTTVALAVRLGSWQEVSCDPFDCSCFARCSHVANTKVKALTYRCSFIYESIQMFNDVLNVHKLLMNFAFNCQMSGAHHPPPTAVVAHHKAAGWSLRWPVGTGQSEQTKMTALKRQALRDGVWDKGEQRLSSKVHDRARKHFLDYSWTFFEALSEHNVTVKGQKNTKKAGCEIFTP